MSNKANLPNNQKIFLRCCIEKNNMILVTDNEQHLSRLQNIKTENWKTQD